MNRNFLKQAQQMQAKLMAAQEELATATVEASAGGGAVKVTATGAQVLTAITIDPAAVDPADVELLQDMVLAAVNEALARSQQMASERMSAITGGMKLPGM
jgi:DNA-binding YbaB/EbfC family protein